MKMLWFLLNFIVKMSVFKTVINLMCMPCMYLFCFYFEIVGIHMDPVTKMGSNVFVIYRYFGESNAFLFIYDLVSSNYLQCFCINKL